MQQLLAADLVDEFQLLIYPVTFGRGKRLFGEGTMPAAFKLQSSQTATTGVIIANYTRDGAVRTGSFAQDKPSAAELERRRTWK
jgi:dihydrofolate reductase